MHMLSCIRRCTSSASLPFLPPEIWSFASCQKASLDRSYNVSSRRCLSTNATRQPGPYNILFAGSDRFSCTILETLVREGRGASRSLLAWYLLKLFSMKIGMIKYTSWSDPTSASPEATKNYTAVSRACHRPLQALSIESASIAMLRSRAEELKLPIHVLPTSGITDWTVRIAQAGLSTQLICLFSLKLLLPNDHPRIS